MHYHLANSPEDPSVALIQQKRSDDRYWLFSVEKIFVESWIGNALERLQDVGHQPLDRG